MVNLFLLSLFMFIGLSMATIDNDGKLHNHHYLNRISRDQVQQRALRNIMGKLIDTETNTIYSLDGQKQQGVSSNLGPAVASMAVNPSVRFLEDLACLEACYKCVEDYPLTSRKKKAADNCGPMCDCADSCSRIPIEQVDKIYGQSTSTRGDKGCFWRTYLQSLNSEVPSLS